jgi:uncharacterized protein
MPVLKRLALVVLCLLPLPVWAECRGTDLFPTFPAADQARIRAATDATPFARGLLWQATKDGETLFLMGTYHFDDPRHDALMARAAPLLDTAQTLLVEAGPDEEAALKSDLARNPALMVATEGPTLPEALAPAEWEALSKAMKARGMPAFMVAKLRPWYVSMMLEIPPCAAAAQAALVAGGLDQRLMRHAAARGIAVDALEPYDTVFRLFGGMSGSDQLAMIRTALATEARAEDYSATLSDSYFAEDARLIWEISRHVALQDKDATPESVAQDMAGMERTLMTERNRAWIPVLEETARKGTVFAAFGALHLSGETGVLALLQANGWTIERLPL